MSEQPFERPPEGEDGDARWEAYVQQTAREFPYPPTPDVVGAARRRVRGQPVRRLRLGWAVALLAALLFLGGLLAVPEVRAAVLEILRLGAIRILLIEPTPTGTATSIPPTATPAGTPGPLRSVLELPGETTLEDAASRTEFPLRLPAYPEDLGQPDRVFYQDLGGPLVTLVWLEPGTDDQVRLTLQLIDERNIGVKYFPRDEEQETRVNGRVAFWLEDTHLIEFHPADGQPDDVPLARVVDRNVLIWREGSVTYRLETDLRLDEAVRIAESLE